ncbi:hypothetical protein JHFBIEKO_2148 [Methylobacterium mesophilicum]|nr:hypothetical protein JHFBIEKO_2148 [Methylobacterium mesophilicum]
MNDGFWETPMANLVAGLGRFWMKGRDPIAIPIGHSRNGLISNGGRMGWG